MNNDPPTALEQRLVGLLLAGDPEPMPALRAQWPRARVVSRVSHEHGTDVTFALPSDEAPVWPWTQEYGDVDFKVAGSDEWRTLNLEIEEGHIRTLRYRVYEAELAAELPMTEWSYTDYIEVEVEEGDCEEEAELIYVAERTWKRHLDWMGMMRGRREGEE